MDHLFTKSKDNDNCERCNFNYLSHTPAARCQVCNKCQTCNVVDDMLLCDKCAEGIKSKQFDLIESSRTIDARLRGNQDFHNASTVPIIELKRTIMADETIINKDEALKNELLIRYEHFSARLFDLQNETYIAQLSKSLIKHNLDELASIIRKEERDRITIADNNYVPPTKLKPIRTKIVKTASTNTDRDKFDKAVSEFMKLNNVSETEAKITITQFFNKMGKKIPE